MTWLACTNSSVFTDRVIPAISRQCQVHQIEATASIAFSTVGVNAEQIARAMKLSIPAVKSRIHRARVFLRNELTPYFIKGRRGN